MECPNCGNELDEDNYCFECQKFFDDDDYADGFEDVDFTDIGVRRIKELDSCYRGHTYMSWLDDQDRTDLVKLANFQCLPDDDCEGTSCPAHEYCDRFKEESEYET